MKIPGQYINLLVSVVKGTLEKRVEFYPREFKSITRDHVIPKFTITLVLAVISSYKSETAKICSDERKTSGHFFLKTLFQTLQTNLHCYSERITMESLFIHLNKPELNKQNSFKELCLL